MSVGQFVFMLHSHLPYYRKAGMWPFGEENLYECMAETYVPLLNAISELYEEGIKAKLTVGITPILAEQLNDEHLQNGFVEYIDSTHTYIVDGHRIPCVSDILSYYSRIHHLDDYSQVSQYTLQRAAQKGTDLHNAIEAYERGESYINYPEIDNYKTIKLKFGFEVIKMEQIVH